MRRNDLETENIQLVCLEIFTEHTKSFLVSVLYRPPNSSKHLCKNKNFADNFNDLLQKINSDNKELIIIGYINCTYFDKSNGKAVKGLYH